MSKISALERGKKKLAEPEAGNNSNVTLEAFPLEDLPTSETNPLWNRIEETYGLTIVELGALQNYACSASNTAAGDEQGGISKKQKVSAIVRAELLTNNPQFVNLQNIYKGLMSRNELKSKSLFIRACYDELYTEIKSDIGNLPQTLRSPVFAITGTAGIGKSSFFLYFLWKYMEDEFFMKDRNGDKSFYFQTEEGKALFCRNTGEFEFTCSEVTTLTLGEYAEENYPLFADMKREVYPLDHNGLVILFSSFKPGRFKEITKQGFIKLMPTWSHEEMSSYIMSDTFGSDFKKSPLEREQILEKFEYFGGIARSVIYYDEEKINKAVLDKGSIICENYFKYGHGGIENYISDVLIHRNPPTDNKGSFVYDVSGKPVVYSFASKHAFYELVSKNKKAKN